MSSDDDDERKDPNFRLSIPPVVGSPRFTRSKGGAVSESPAPEIPPKKVIGRGKQTTAVSSNYLSGWNKEDTAAVNPSGSVSYVKSVNPLHTPTKVVNPLGTPSDPPQSNLSPPRMAEQAYNEMKAAFKDIALSTKINDLKSAQDLPFFGRAKDPTGKVWVVDTIEELVDYIKKATPDETWNDAGRVKLLRSKLCGLSREYFNTFAGDTLDNAKAFLLKMYPDTTSYVSLYQELDKLKRRPSEQISDFAIRITMLYTRLQKVSNNKLTPDWLEVQKKETLLKNLPPQVRNFVDPSADTYDQLLTKILLHLESNTQYKLTKLDISHEADKGIKGINALKSDNAKDKGGSGGKDSQGGGKDNAGVAALGSNSSGNDNTQKSNPPRDNPDNKKGEGNSRGGHRGGSRGGRGDFRGGRGASRGNRGNYRGGGNSRGGNSRGRGFRGGNAHYNNTRACYICQRTNHLARDCWFKEGNNEQPSGTDQGSAPQGGGATGQQTDRTQTFKCFKCGGINHRADVCPSPRVF